MNTMTFDFDELPLVLAPGVEAAFVNGRAEIEYSSDGLWEITEVSLEGYRKLSFEERADGVKPWVYIPASAHLEHLIIGRLDNEWQHKVQEAVSEQIAEDRACAADAHFI
jgi:hypothetical protein